MVALALPSKEALPVTSPLKARVRAVASLVAVVAVSALDAEVAVAALPVISPTNRPLASLTGIELAVGVVDGL